MNEPVKGYQWNNVVIDDMANDLPRCEACGDLSSDVVPCVREKTTYWRGAPQDVPVRVGSLCGECRTELKAVPEKDF